MNAKLVLTLVVAILLLLGVVLLVPTTAQGQTTGFIISNADAVAYVSTTVSSQLITLIGNVPPRFVVQHANGIRYYSIPPISSTLTSLMAQVGDRFVMQYANANRDYSFAYPLAMIGDTVPPFIVTPPPSVSSSGSNATITWFTNEFATTIFSYGIQPGVYAQTITDTLYYRLHEFTLTGLTPGTRYYYRATHTDRSGNIFQSVEYSFVAKISVYLPLIKK